MPYLRTNHTPSVAETEAWTRAHLAKLGLRRGRRFAGGRWWPSPREEAAARALSGVARRLEAAVAAPVAPASRSIMPKMSTPKKNPDHALNDALHACDRLMGRRHAG